MRTRLLLQRAALTVAIVVAGASVAVGNEPVLADPVVIPGSTTDVLDLAVGDVNDDGRPDVIACGPSGIHLMVRTDDGFDVSPLRPGGAASPACTRVEAPVRLDGIGTLHLVFDGGVIPREGDGTWGAVAHSDVLAGAVGFGLADPNRDGRVDLFVGREGDGLNRVVLHTRDDAGGFGPEELVRTPRASRHMTALDVDHDGIREAVYVEDGGTYAIMQVVPEVDPGADADDLWDVARSSITVEATGMVLADVDADGAVDAVDFGGRSVQVHRLIDGSDGATFVTGGRDVEAVVAHLDGDLLPDYVAVNASGRIRTIRWRTGGPVVETLATGIGASVTAIAALDMDGDGDDDLVVAADAGVVLVENRRAASRFAPRLDGRRVTSIPSDPAFATGDVDFDGDDDIVIGHSTRGTDLYLRQDDGTWTRQTVSDRRAQRAPAFGDMDNDGDIDLVVPTSDGVMLVRNPGAGAWATEPIVPDPDSAVRVVDFDQDGALDVVWASVGGILAGSWATTAPAASKSSRAMALASNAPSMCST